MKYPCKQKFVPTGMIKMKIYAQCIDKSMDIHEQACVAVVGASNKTH
jgi:hypothetical protein